MYPLSVYHNQALERWMDNNPGRVVTVFQFGKIFGESYLQAAVPLNAMNGFLKCGRVPYNAHIFSNIDFIAAKTTDQPAETESLEQDINFANANRAEPIENRMRSVSDTGSAAEVDNEIWDSTASTNSAPEEPYRIIKANTSFSTSSPSVFTHAGPSAVKPLPKMTGNRTKSKRARGCTVILTSTPYKKQLEEERKKKLDLEVNKAKGGYGVVFV